jgi:SAM-dependent methyltransferase
LQAPPAPVITGTAPSAGLRAALREDVLLEPEPESSATPALHEDHAVVSEPKATAIMAMRIIVVGESSRVQLRSDMPPPLESSPPPPETIEVATEPPERPLTAVADTAEELAEEDVAPDSEERVSVSEPTSVPPGDDSARRPPPPPRRPATATAEAPSQREKAEIAPPREKTETAQPREKVEIAPPREKTETAPPQRERKETLDDSPRGRQRRPWWEELFGEDFIRATKRLSEVQVRQECTFIEESLGVAAGGVVLDLGCGSGHHAVELASRGYGVVGYDLSLFQLALAADVAQEQDQRLNFLQGDMREMAFEEMFDGVYCWNTTFGYFEEEKNVAVAQRVFKALRPGGMFLLDVANRDFVVAQSPSQVWYEGEGCVCMDDMNVDFITSRLRVKRSVILDDGRTRECNYSIRLYALHELGKLLHEVGFRVTEASGHPSMPGVFFGQFSPRIIILAQRP